MADSSEPAAKKQKTEEEEKAEEPKAEEPKAEEAKEEAKEEPKEEPKPEVKEPEPPKELEEDAKADSKARVKETAAFLVPDTTLNVLPSVSNNVLMGLTEGGMQHLLAGARGSVGLKSGRYMFEVKVVELCTPMEEHGRPGPRPKNLVKVGFSTAGSSLMLGSGEESVCFDSEGAFTYNKSSSVAGQRFGRDNVVAVLLNLDASSPNANTVSLFKDGVRASQPQALPEALKGKPLFPTVSFKCATVHVNFGPSPLKPLPFVCRMVQDATGTDAVVTKVKEATGEVVLPVGLPDEGTFDWLDIFLKKHPQYIELSDRMVLDWCEKSGVFKQRGYGAKSNNDRPEYNFGIRELDDGSIRRSLQAVASIQQRDYIVMEVKDNLVKESRKDTLARFAGFKKVAQVVVGEPNAEFKKQTQALMLKAKQEASDMAFKLKKAEEKRKKVLEKRQKELERARKKAEKEAAKKAEEEAKKKAAEEAKAAGEEEKKEEEAKEEAKPDEEMKEEEDEEMKEEPEEEDNEEPPKAELSDEEKKLSFKKPVIPDLAPFVLNVFFTKFSMPEKDEGFDEIKYEWSKGAQSADYLKKWVLERKLTLRMEDLQPSAWFMQKSRDWTMALQKWHAKQNEYKASVAKKVAEKAAKEAKKAKAAAEKEAKAKAKEEAKKAAEEAKAKAIAEGQDPPPEEEQKEEEPEPMEEEEKEEEEVKVDFEGIDIFGVQDVCDIGGGMPLFKDFAFEDWTMMSLHFELHMLAHAFKHDADDPERVGIHIDNLAFYYNKYYKKPLTTKAFGVDSWKALCDMAADAVAVNKQNAIESQLEVEMESYQVFVKMAEEARRHRLIQIDLGEESARLKLSQPAAHPPAPQKGGGGYKGGYEKGGYEKGGYEKGGYEKGGYEKGYDKGYDKGGYDKGSAQKGGYAQGGYDKGSAQKGDQKGAPKGYGYGPPKGGYEKGGYDKGGYDKGGYDKGGYGKGGYDKGGYDKGKGKGKDYGKDRYHPYGGKGGVVPPPGKGGYKGGYKG